MRYCKIRAFAIGLSVLLLSGLVKTAGAANPVVHISPRPLWISALKPYDQRPPARSIENGYFLMLFERQMDVDRAADYHHFIREIVSEAGIQNGSQISVSFDPAYERLDFHEIVVWRDNKPQNRLNPADFKVMADEQDFSKFIYQGSYSANYIIPDIRKGDRIEYSYTITGRNPVFGGRFCQDLYIQGGQVIAHQYLSLQASASRKLYVKNFNKVPNPVITTANGAKHYVWESFQVPAADDLGNSPGWYDTYANIQVSEYDNWAQVINWALAVNPVSSALHGELAQRVAKLKAEAGNDKEKYFRLAVKMVQDEVRYMGIEIGEYSHRANQPERVFNQRYGDCKDKALLLVSILRANNIQADMVLVNTSLQDKVERLLPTTDAFNHAVAVATVNGKQVWVDATMSYQRGKGTDLYFPKYGKGLQLKPGNTGLVDIPVTKLGKITSREKYTVTKVSDKVRLDVTSTYTLDEADDIRSRLASNGLYTTEKNYLKYYAKIYPKIEKRDSLIVKDDEERNELTTIESYLIPDFFTRDTTVVGKFTAGFYANSIDEQLPTITNQTKNPVTLNYPYDIDYTIEVVLPSGWGIADRQYDVKRDAYHFNSDYTAKGNSLLLHYQFSFLKDFIPVDQLEQARQDISLLRDSKLSYSFSYTPGAGNYDTAGIKLHPNVWMIALALITLVICVGLAIWIYHIETPGIVFAHGASFVAIGGWLILVLIGLFITPFIVANTFITGDYFSMSAWNLYTDTGRSSAIRALIVWETIGYTLIFCLAVFCLVLFLNKRDILPKTITVYLGFIVVFNLVDYLLSLRLHSDTVNYTTGYAMVRSIIAAAIWIPYFRRSERVHETFIVPHPPYNFSYEKPGPPAE
ncbi:DUF3857 domain-containing protein [Mucilaginibacter mali]|uniref:DUF3857 domain-containing protein n=1 Tax=Mucilaginibacter mali TaxID=2740462 RepID=A0A7D4QSP5_9SPHI|nr:DUF3857 domain-containing protein [Mucilaginibacter mali]QKJ30169.1 DUF3857 domain-containing protein [Mucilaginibacter mali]